MSAPWLMPDGHSSLQAVLKREKARAAAKAARNAAHAQEIAAAAQTASEAELAELQSIARVGARRRRRWLNEKTLRDLAGPMSAADMESQFAPVPFGSYGPPSAFAAAMAEPSNMIGFFLSIDSDKQDKILQRWEEHNRGAAQQAQQAQQVQQLVGSPGSSSSAASEDAQAGAALLRWSRVSRPARAALKRASLAHVLELEGALLEHLEHAEADAGAELLLEADAYGRLLLRGLGQFHSVQISRAPQGGDWVAVRGRGSGAAGCGLTCGDVLLSMQALGPDFNRAGLSRFAAAHGHHEQLLQPGARQPGTRQPGLAAS